MHKAITNTTKLSYNCNTTGCRHIPAPIHCHTFIVFFKGKKLIHSSAAIRLSIVFYRLNGQQFHQPQCIPHRQHANPVRNMIHSHTCSKINTSSLTDFSFYVTRPFTYPSEFFCRILINEIIRHLQFSALIIHKQPNLHCYKNRNLHRCY